MESKAFDIRPADRLADVTEYYFSRKLKEVAAMNAEGKDVISLAGDCRNTLRGSPKAHSSRVSTHDRHPRVALCNEPFLQTLVWCRTRSEL